MPPDPVAYRPGVGGGHHARHFRNEIFLTIFVDQPWRMEAQDRPPRDADFIARDRAQDKSACRIAGTINDNAFTGLAQHGEKLEIMTDYTSGTGLDPHLGRSRVEADEKKERSIEHVSHRTPRMPWTRPARPNAGQRTQTVLRRRCSTPILSHWPLSNWRRSVAPSQNDRARSRVLLLRTIDRC